MPDFPGVLSSPLAGGLSSYSGNAGVGDLCRATGTATGNGVWPTGNTALYMPVVVEKPVTVYQVAVNVITQSGNLDVGIYEVTGKRIVSKGSTAVAAAGLQVIDITDTPLVPGVYFLGMNVDNGTASFTRMAPGIAIAQICGVQQQAVGAVTLPDPAVFANPAASYVPFIYASVVATV